jgi:hypothetical protein
MKRHVALTLLIITTLGVVDAHVDLTEVDGRGFLATQGRLYDPLGWLEDQANAVTRSCGAVQTVDLKTAEAQTALARIREFSPPQPRWPLQIPPPVATPNSPRQDGRIMTALG